MNAMLNMLKAMGFDPDAMKANAEALFNRFTTLEKNVGGVTEDRLIQVEAELQRIKEHLGLDEPHTETVHSSMALPAPEAEKEPDHAAG